MWDGIRNKYIEQQREKPVSNEVKVYKLSPEELEKYRKSGAKEANRLMSDQNSQGELTKEKYLELKEKGISDTEIAKQYDIQRVKLSRMKVKWGLKGLKIDMKDEGQKTSGAVPQDIQPDLSRQEEIAKLKKELEEKEKELRHLAEWNERILAENGDIKRKYEKIKEALKVLL